MGKYSQPNSEGHLTIIFLYIWSEIENNNLYGSYLISLYTLNINLYININTKAHLTSIKICQL
jgi:hypothetical protein